MIAMSAQVCRILTPTGCKVGIIWHGLDQTEDAVELGNQCGDSSYGEESDKRKVNNGKDEMLVFELPAHCTIVAACCRRCAAGFFGRLMEFSRRLASLG